MQAVGIQSTATLQHHSSERLRLRVAAKTLQVADDVAEDVQHGRMSRVEPPAANGERLSVRSVGRLESLLLVEKHSERIVVVRELQGIRTEAALVDLDRDTVQRLGALRLARAGQHVGKLTDRLGHVGMVGSERSSPNLQCAFEQRLGGGGSTELLERGTTLGEAGCDLQVTLPEGALCHLHRPREQCVGLGVQSELMMDAAQ